MEVQKFPPSPNWNSSDILCAGPHGIVIYGSRNTLVVANFEDKLFDNPSFPKCELIDLAHKERITSVRCCPSESAKYSRFFATGGDDSIVKLWNMTTLSPVMANFAHGDEKKIIAMDWTWKSSSFVLSVDDAGFIVAWDLEKNLTTKINVTKLLQAKKNTMLKAYTGKLLPLVIKCCPHQEDLVAVGIKGGLVCLITLRDSGQVLHCMRAHDKDVTSLSWCPVQENVLEGKDDMDQDKAFLLASVCKDRLIYIWRGIDGNVLRKIKLPHNFLGRQARLNASGSYINLDWTMRDTIVCSSNYGEIMKFDLSSRNRDLNDVDDLKSDGPIQPKWCLVHDIHPRCVFAVQSALYPKSRDCGAEKKAVVWSTAQDRHLVAVSLDDGKILVNLPTIGGFVYCMAPSPFDPSRIAVGVGDFSIRIWNTGNTKEIQMSTLWQKIKGKVMAIAWHPMQEMKLAFGTHEGRVGIQDITPGRLPVVFILRHKSAVYSLSWGPPCYKEGDTETLPQHCLYSCGDNEILQYNPEAPEKEPKRMSLLMRGSDVEHKRKMGTCTDVAWKPDNSLLAVGNSDGTMQLFTPPHLKLVYTLYAHRKLLMTLVWHPIGTSSDTGLSPMRHCLATGSNENVIHVYDFTNLIKAVTAGVEYNNPIQTVAKLSGHQKKVVNLSWSPHSSGQLCSASYDNTIRVWDVIHETCLACFMGHSGAGLACMWSSYDPDVIISGSTDFTLCAWRISMCKYVKKSTTGGSAKKKPPPVTVASAETTEKVETANGGSSASLPVAKSVKDVESSKGSFTWKGSLFPISWKVSGGIGMVNGVRRLLEKEEKGTLEAREEPNSAKLLFFGDRNDMHHLLKKEEEHHKSQGNMEQAQLMELWRGNVADMIKDAIAKGNLSDWLVSMAPTASHKLWVEACQAYSEQLAANGKYNHAATYLLACHKVDDAIKLLRSRSLYREALAIAHCRLAPDDPTAHEIMVEWGWNLFHKGNYEVAAMCFTAAEEYLAAAKALANRSTYPECIATAAALALKAGDEGKQLALMFSKQCMHINLQNNDWDAALDCVNKVKDLKPLSLVIELQRKLEECFKAHENGGDNVLCEWLTQRWKEGDSSLGQSSQNILKSFTSLPWSNDDKLSASEAYTCISNWRGEKVADAVKNFFLELAEELALSICAASSEGEVNLKKWNHILKAMSLCYSQQVLGAKSEDVWNHSLLKLCSLLAPNGPESITQLFEGFGADSQPEGFTRSIKAYTVFAAVSWVEGKWVVKNENKWPWSELAAFMLGNLEDILDPQVADYFKVEMEIHKMEQELIKAKSKSRMAGENSCSGALDKPLVGENGIDSKECSPKGEGLGDGESDNTGEGAEAVPISGSKTQEKTLEAIISVKEAEIGVLRDRKELFERSRISAPNPFISFFKLRNVCDMIVKSYGEEEDCLPCDVQKLKDKISSGIAF
ncbi:gem-associated protein 5-like [Hetaerina americana]|uniref:gem-associated protein 5-like n=1 Tax=Hetaerina americana TaxID=62018 RepID=UPI003A7F310C